MRQASFQGLREDKPAKEVVREVKSRGGGRQDAAAKTQRARGATPAKPTVTVGEIALTHPDRVYWDDAGVTKRDLAEYLRARSGTGCGRTSPAGRLRCVRCPEGAAGQCFFQKHASAGIATEHLHLVPEKGDKIISIDDLDGLIALVQARRAGNPYPRHAPSTISSEADRLVFDLDPGPGAGWKDVVAAAREVRERLAAFKLKSFVKTSGGKGLHVVVPIKPAPWDEAKDFCHAIAASDGGGQSGPLRRDARPKASATTASSSITCATAARRPRSRPIRPARGPARRFGADRMDGTRHAQSRGPIYRA